MLEKFFDDIKARVPLMERCSRCDDEEWVDVRVEFNWWIRDFDCCYVVCSNCGKKLKKTSPVDRDVEKYLRTIVDFSDYDDINSVDDIDNIYEYATPEEVLEAMVYVAITNWNNWHIKNLKKKKKVKHGI